jgi:hypothetical protein
LNWSAVGNFIKGAAPEVAKLLANPAAEAVSLGARLISKAVGTEEKPDAVMEQLKNDPQALVEVKKLNAQIAEMNEVTQAANIIRTAASSEDPYVRRTRPMILRRSFWATVGFAAAGILAEVVMAICEVKEGIIRIIVDGNTEVVKYFSGLLLAGFLGYVRYRSVHDKALAAGREPPSVLGGIRKLLGK